MPASHGISDPNPVFLQKRGSADGDLVGAISAGETFSRSIPKIGILPQSQSSIFGCSDNGFAKWVLGVLLSDSRIEATERMKKTASDRGANAVLAMRFDTADIGRSMNEVAAYGTAVTIRPLKP